MIKLLSIGADTKTVKGEKYGVKTAIFYGMAAKGVFDRLRSEGIDYGPGRSMCPWATDKCAADCLGLTAGMMAMPAQQEAQYKRTRFFVEHEKDFLAQMTGEIDAFIAKAKRANMKPAIRLNGATDILWERFNIIQDRPLIQFYDYTKAPAHVRKLPANYHLTYSYTGKPESIVESFRWQKLGVNTAVVFNGGLPDTFLGRKVIDGDASDLRFTDPKNVIVGLKAKGKARKDTSEFVVQVVNGKVQH